MAERSGLAAERARGAEGHPVLMMTPSALKDHMPQLTRATALDRAEHFAMLECDLCRGRFIVLLQKPVAVLPQTVCDGCLQAPHGEPF